MFGWLRKISDKIKDLNICVDNYKKETENQVIPSVAYVNRAKKHIDAMRYEDAKKILNEALEISQKDALVYKYLGVCEERLGNYSASIDAYRKSAALNPQDKNIWHKLGLVQITVKDYLNAEKSFIEANRISPINTDIQTGWGMSLLKQQKIAEAHEKFVNAIQINRYNFAAMLLAAISEVKLGKYDDAENKLNFLVNANPNESCMFEFANLYFLKENYEAAIRYAKKSIEYNPNMLPAYILLGKVYSMQFDYTNSVKYFTVAENRELINTILYLEWGNALIRLYRFAEAQKMYQKVLSEDTENSDAQAGMALCAAEINDFEKANTYIEYADAKNIGNVFLLEAKGILAFTQNKTDEAIKYFKQALEKEPKNTYNYYRLAKCYQSLENDAMIRDSYDKILKYNPECVAAYIDYSKYLISKQENKDAQRKLRKAEKLEPDNQEILNLLFYTSYILVKERVCEYNVKEAIAIADKITDFKYPELRSELEGLLKGIKNKE